MLSFLVCVAALVGGFLAALFIDRCIRAVQGGTSLFAPVVCENCERKLEMWDRVPLISWFLNGGKCRFCSAKVSTREPIISMLTIAVWIASVSQWMPRGPGMTITAAAAASGLICAAGLCRIGASERPILLPLLLSMGILGVLLPDGVDQRSHLFGAAGMLAFCLLIRYTPLLRGAECGLRLDTALYLSCTGLLIGWRSCFVILPAALLIGLAMLLWARRKQKDPVMGKPAKTETNRKNQDYSFASMCMTGGGVIALVFGRTIMNWYLSLFSLAG